MSHFSPSGGFWVLLLAGAVSSIAPTIRAYRAKPLPAHTGGFGEPSCQECHWDSPLNDSGGTLTLRGVPASYSPGRSYRLTVALERPGLRRAGFQLTARVRDGESAGRQAGVLGAVGERVLIQLSEGVEYAGHSETGTQSSETGTESIRWVVEWRAPEADGGAVVFHAAANASNDDDSELGDFVHLTSAQAVAIR